MKVRATILDIIIRGNRRDTYYVGYYFLLILDERGRTCRLYNRVPTTVYIQAIGLTSYDTLTCRLCYAT